MRLRLVNAKIVSLGKTLCLHNIDLTSFILKSTYQKPIIKRERTNITSFKERVCIENHFATVALCQLTNITQVSDRPNFRFGRTSAELSDNE